LCGENELEISVFVPVLSAALSLAAADVPQAPEQAMPPTVAAEQAPPPAQQPVIVLPPIDSAAPQDAPPPMPAEPAPASTAAPAASSKDQIVVTGEVDQPKSDPAQAVNQASFEVVQKVDDALVAPLAMGYKHALPSPVRSGLRNFLRNLTEPVVFVNFLLQGKPGKAAETLGRFAVNSTVGIAGLVDVAKNKPINLPYRENGFANTLGYYGVGPGPYLFLPLIGPTTVRDLFGLGVDRAMLPATVGGPLRSPYYVFGAGAIKSLDDRIQLDCELQKQRESSNPYNTAREYYLERRKADIEALHGRKYQPVGHSLLDVMSQCSKENQRAKTDVIDPDE
jgi:phospholipid-binding lipoprotein MlaA